MSLQNQKGKAAERLAQIDKDTTQIQEGFQASLNEIRTLGEHLVEKAKSSRAEAQRLANLRAEARFLCLTHGLEISEPAELEGQLDLVKGIWAEVASLLKPIAPSEEWLEKIRFATVAHEDHSLLSEEESAQLRKRLEETICPLCVNFALDGTCTLEAFEECPITSYQDRVVDMIQRMGHRPWMEDYFQRMYREICPLCRDKSTGGVCVPREEGDCALFSYLPAIVKTVEDFLKEREEET